MPDVMCIVSKAVFEKEARVDGEVIGLGDVWPVDRYNSNHKTLEGLSEGGRIFLVTVRPPDEKLWFVGVVDQPKLKGKAWVSATKNTHKVTDITPLRRTIKFESGKGMSQDKGALGMSLQTPRVLAADDATQILAMIGGAAQGAPSSGAKAKSEPVSEAEALLAQIDKDPTDEKVRESVLRELVAQGAFPLARRALEGVALLNAHDEGALPCLCKGCWETTPSVHELSEMKFRRDVVIKDKRALFFWAPSELDKNQTALRNSVRAALSRRLADLSKKRKRARRDMPEF